MNGQQIADLFVTAIETPAGDWFQDFQLVESKNVPEERPWYASANVFADDNDLTIRIDVEDPDEPGTVKIVNIGRQDINEALQLMSKNHSRHFADFVNDNADADTADVFMQLVTLKDIVYG